MVIESPGGGKITIYKKHYMKLDSQQKSIVARILSGLNDRILNGQKDLNTFQFTKEEMIQLVNAAKITNGTVVKGTYEESVEKIKYLIKEAIKLKSGSKEPGRVVAGSITKAQLKKIAEIKMKDLNAFDIEQAIKIIAGSARSMGVEVKD